MIEVWKSVPGFDKYEASTDGRIRSVDTIDNMGRLKIGQMRKLCSYTNGYLGLVMSNDGNKKMYQAHRIIALTFISNEHNLPCVNHKNGIKTDNRIENLEWVSYSDNNKHAHATGLRKAPKHINESNGNAKLTIDQVIKIKKFIAFGKSCRSIAKSFNVSPSTIDAIKNNLTWSNII